MSSILIGCTMTIQELYYFAINHSLLNNEINDVIREYMQDSSNIQPTIRPLELDKVEYTFEDVIALFST